MAEKKDKTKSAASGKKAEIDFRNLLSPKPENKAGKMHFASADWTKTDRSTMLQVMRERRRRSILREMGSVVPLRGEARQEVTAVRLTLPTKLLTKFDQFCEEHDYNRVEGIRQAIREMLENFDFDSSEAKFQEMFAKLGQKALEKEADQETL